MRRFLERHVSRPPARAVLRFPGSAEVRFLKRPPRRGQRIESVSGDVWVVADVLRSGTDTYTVECVGLRTFLRELRERPSSDLTGDLLATVRGPIRSLRDVTEQPIAGPRRTRRGKVTRYIASFAAQNGEVLDYLATARTDEEAEREARDAAKRFGMTLLRVQRG
jgi:hypothetical protein